MTDQQLAARAWDIINDAPEEVKEQFKVMVEAMAVYEERDEVRGDLWRRSGIEDAAHHLKSKSMRIMAMLSSGVQKKPELLDEAVDEGLDAINYAVFYIRHLRGGH